jgi:hypothetical protein
MVRRVPGGARPTLLERENCVRRPIEAFPLHLHERSPFILLLKHDSEQYRSYPYACAWSLTSLTPAWRAQLAQQKNVFLASMPCPIILHAQ